MPPSCDSAPTRSINSLRVHCRFHKRIGALSLTATNVAKLERGRQLGSRCRSLRTFYPSTHAHVVRMNVPAKISIQRIRNTAADGGHIDRDVVLEIVLADMTQQLF